MPATTAGEQDESSQQLSLWLEEASELSRRENYYDVEVTLRQAQRLAEAKFGKESAWAGRVLVAQAANEQARDRLDDAVLAARRASQIWERSEQIGSSERSACLIKIARLLQDAGELTDAESLLRSLAADIEATQHGSAEAAIVLARLADTLRARNRPAEAVVF